MKIELTNETAIFLFIGITIGGLISLSIPLLSIFAGIAGAIAIIHNSKNTTSSFKILDRKY